MAFLRIRVPTAIGVILIVLGLPVSASILYFGVAHLIGGTWADFVPALVLCALGVFLLLMANGSPKGVNWLPSCAPAKHSRVAVKIAMHAKP